MWFYNLPTGVAALLVAAIAFGAVAVGARIGHGRRELSESLREPFSVLQGALLGIVALVLAFGLSIALDRYESRRTAVVDDANAIGTTYLRAQTLREPMRTRSLRDLVAYTDAAIDLTNSVPGSDEAHTAVAEGQEIQRRLWGQAGRALEVDPVASAPRLYVDSLNEMIDQQTVRVAGLSNHLPGAVKFVELVGSAIALGLLAAYLAVVGRSILPALLAAGLVASLLFVTADLDRPHRGPIQVPDTALANQRDSEEEPPAARGPPPKRPD
jgi:hypothetical protein